jgi:uncharacterized membrane protein
MSHLKEVQNLGNGRSHWVAVGPGGILVSWNAEITDNVLNKRLAWKSCPAHEWTRKEASGLMRTEMVARA